jgi:hypothetical protein
LAAATLLLPGINGVVADADNAGMGTLAPSIPTRNAVAGSTPEEPRH